MDWISFGIGIGAAFLVFMTWLILDDAKKQRDLKRRKHERAVAELYEQIRDDVDGIQSKHGVRLSSVEDRLQLLEVKRK
jgi:hypothetical protein